MNNKTRQVGVVIRKEEEGGYSAIIPSLPGCVSQGETFEEVQKNVVEAISLYLEGENIDALLGDSQEVYSPVQVPVQQWQNYLKCQANKR